MAGAKTKKIPKNRNIKTIATPIAPGGIAGWFAVPLDGRFANTLGMTNPMTTSMMMPITSQLQEKMSKSARAQRRAMMEPMPSQISITARTP